MNRNRYGCLSLVLFLALCASLLVNFLVVVGRGSRSTLMATKKAPRFEEEVAVAARAGESGADSKIVLIYLRGIITSAEAGNLGETAIDDLKLQLRQAAEDAKVKAIVLYVDSPGGEVTASDTLYQAVKSARDKKPVVVYMGSMAASGGYYVACGGSQIIANETTLTGSIGVIMQSLQYKGLMDKVGLGVVTFKSGKFKDLLSGSRELTDEEKEYVQNLVMQTYEKFVGIVAAERKQEVDALRNGVADGRVLSGKDALVNKLIDSLGTVEDAYAKAMELGGAPGAAIVKYDSGFKLGKLFKLLSESESKAKLEVSFTESLRPKIEPGRLYYLPGFLAN